MVDVVIELIEQDVKLDDTNKFGHTALTWACAGTHSLTYSLTYLLTRSLTYLLTLSLTIGGHTEVVRVLLFRGANIHHVTNEGRNGLHYACLYAKARTVKILFDFLFERFSTLRLKHSQTQMDATRWGKYATFMEQFMNVKDKNGMKALTWLLTHVLNYSCTQCYREISLGFITI